MKCKLCEQQSNLQMSHAIPDSFFRRLFSHASGKAIQLNGSKRIKYTSDSLQTEQLCSDCERTINENYEKYSIAVFRNEFKNVKRTEYGIIFDEVDTSKITIFFLSILWRAAASNHESYGQAVFPSSFLKDGTVDRLKDAILNGLPIPVNKFSLKIERLYDRSNEISLEMMKGIIITPFYRQHKKTRKIEVCFLIEGFFVTVIMPGLNFKERKSERLIDIKSSKFIAKYKNFLSDQTLLRIFIEAKAKHESGMSDL